MAECNGLWMEQMKEAILQELVIRKREGWKEKALLFQEIHLEIEQKGEIVLT